MVKWVRRRAGDYLSEGQRFHVTKMNSKHWILVDSHTRSMYHFPTFGYCKQLASGLVDLEAS